MINPSNMRVVDVARLLNSTSFGFVLAQARLYRDFNRVGFRIGSSENPRNINLLKYIAWMFDRKHTPEETSGARSYEDRRNAERDRQAEQSLAGRDIGPLPEVVNPDRKAACERNFQLFCESYFPETYALAWSPDHMDSKGWLPEVIKVTRFGLLIFAHTPKWQNIYTCLLYTSQ